MIARYAIPFFFIVGMIVVPALCYCICRMTMRRKRTARLTALGITLFIYIAIAYGMTVGFEQFRVRHIDYASATLPKAFNGYRIVQFTDAHLGTLTGQRQWMLRRAVDSINAMKPDAIVFTGDLVNLCPSEIKPHLSELRRLKARDGVFSVLGNHDYPIYLELNKAEKEDSLKAIIALERQAGWQLLMNDHRTLYRDSDSIIIAGMENWGKARRMPRQGNVAKSLKGVKTDAYVVMLQHDPSCWQKQILPQCQAQLTLSGHTHGGQVKLLGWSPVASAYEQWAGLYKEGQRAINVSTGLGGLIPFRLFLPGEVVVITLRAEN